MKLLHDNIKVQQSAANETTKAHVISKLVLKKKFVTVYSNDDLAYPSKRLCSIQRAHNYSTFSCTSLKCNESGILIRLKQREKFTDRRIISLPMIVKKLNYQHVMYSRQKWKATRFQEWIKDWVKYAWPKMTAVGYKIQLMTFFITMTLTLTW